MSKKWRDPEGEHLYHNRLSQIVMALRREDGVFGAFIAGAVTWHPLSTKGALRVAFGTSPNLRHAVLALSDRGTTLRLGEHDCTMEELSEALEKAGLVPVE